MDKGPIVVHCSAGIGRSGSFMVISSIISNPLFNQLIANQSHSNLDTGRLLLMLSQFRIPDMVLLFRQKRHPGIVQTQQQYNFIYTTLVDEICRPTTVSECLKKAIEWHSEKIMEKEFLSRSGPYILKKNYLQFLSEHTSNDLHFIFNRNRENMVQCSQNNGRSFLTQSTPLLNPFVDNFHRLLL